MRWSERASERGGEREGEEKKPLSYSAGAGEGGREREGRKEGRGEALSGRWGTDHGRMDGRRAAGLIMQLPLSLSGLRRLYLRCLAGTSRPHDAPPAKPRGCVEKEGLIAQPRSQPRGKVAAVSLREATSLSLFPPVQASSDC